ncbi:lysophospholipid acyltransferase family protein [Desulfurivibrio alkaliphilus]|uniref:Lipid A biosynthesis acyltransferase n=1 Tax=Desulfurivibrio alkaliphilus (strain DSM 19089 / UNIQEM U267 / AHT2) TaxID=589865 RepID=D6Z2P7_DESAT|nr:lysophospholipid acyltransferase family protein [Desulfurivibrio alkaliphilus]ADH85822.1 lipid A biosynthesis acyltransferase [Desulfurivibrio alkaliphilus AHT 2]
MQSVGKKQPGSGGWQRLEALGHSCFYLTLRLFGLAGAYLLLVPVVAVYLLGSREIHRRTRPYLQRRFPELSRWGLWLATFKNVHSFGRVLVDRAWLGMGRNRAFAGETAGYEQLLKLVAEGKGVVLLTAHVGNWQTALAHLERLPVPVHALMHYDQQAVAKHFFDLRPGRRPFHIISTDGPLGGVVEATAALQRGEVVTIMGDRLVKGSSVTVDFLGAPVRLPDAAYVLAGCVGAPVAAMFAAKTGRRRYQLRIRDVWYPRWQGRNQRAEACRASGARFARSLQEHVDEYPYQWYNFYDFWQQ